MIFVPGAGKEKLNNVLSLLFALLLANEFNIVTIVYKKKNMLLDKRVVEGQEKKKKQGEYTIVAK